MRTAALHTAEVFDLEFDEHRLVTASGDHSVRIWDLQSGVWYDLLLCFLLVLFYLLKLCAYQ